MEPQLAEAQKIRPVVLGAGVCGLYAAHTLAKNGLTPLVLEKEEVVGGLAAGRRQGENYYDFGVHHLHAHDREIFEELQSLLGPRLQSVEKSALIRYGKGFRRYPLQFMDILKGIPPLELMASVSGLAWQSLRNRFQKQEAENAEQALIELYGKPLYRHFFQDFTERYWGIPTTELSATFVRTKMPRLSAVDVLKKLMGRFGLKDQKDASVESATLEETLYYPPTGARELSMSMAASVEKQGGLVHLNTPVEAVEHQGGEVEAVVFTDSEGRSRRQECPFLLSTIPLPSLVQVLRPSAPDEVQHAARQLSFKGTAVYGYLVRKEKILDALFVYFRDRIFHRLAEPKLSGLQVQPPGHTLLLAETTCDPGDDRWLGGAETRARMVSDLEAEGLIQKEDIVETHVFVQEHAYPVFRLGFEPYLDTVQNWLGGIPNLRSVGRNGGFCYPNMHGAMRMGAEAAFELSAMSRKGGVVEGHP
ncbi:MAG: FAD-dependent oxidoreductase [Planctomycetota bacterium]|nr:MAG: FAD-dependent oxidoreductase [Planctomycetota bacterium]